MKRKKIIIAAMALALAVLAPAWSRAQSAGIYSGSGSWGLFNHCGVDDNGSGSGA